VTRERTSDNSHSSLRFYTRLIIRHPFCDPISITKELGIKPKVAHMAGDKRKTPAGTLLQGFYTETLWSHSIRISGSRFFFDAMEPIVKRLEKSRDYLEKLTTDGGEISINFDLAGDENIGDLISLDTLQRIAKLNVRLGIEVFPHLPTNSAKLNENTIQERFNALDT
jgi:hypothetical protein